ncbi:MAG: DUF4292 domain-containing protein [Prolixibacteraceae bacterium]|jgi:hypothetical protein|nr:DUF4292 domain-containing protein [Prolixibacteraceae bacterium]MDI9562757.1 DUF4292 domain-containing protein [Bacteroidota bacterium]NLS99702.1 DUF4292 domain-containing protein [Bacteroidales bacterium]OQB81758.1 MAG: hypothetical protein BWX87_00444 [Bacteroidetes bacterium ADurb.Bin123]HNZ67765.1 DUF4292 domain-containing protein [Prolixibacteraceae bacterium]
MDHHRNLNPLRLVVLFTLVFLFSCKTTEKVPAERLRPVSSQKIFRKAEENSFDYIRFNIKRINVQFDDGKNSGSLRAGIQAVRDSSVLISISKFNLLVARVLMTPDSVLYVNYFEKSYYSGTYAPLSRKMGLDLNFRTVQAILSADVFSLFEKPGEMQAYDTRIEEGMYVLYPEASEKAAMPVVYTYYFDPLLFVVRKIRMEDLVNSRMAEMVFSDYEQVGVKYYPAAMELNVTSERNRMSVIARMSGFSTEDGEFVTLKIPEKYQRVSLN